MSRNKLDKKAFKLVILGESSVGKSSIALRFCKATFLEYAESTIGAAFMTQSVSLNNNVIKLEIWDTAGQERYRALAPMYYRGSQVGIIVYDVTQKTSLDMAKSWIQELQKQGPNNILIYLVGNKVDMENDREISYEEGERCYLENSLAGFFETSAKTAFNVNELFVKIAKDLADLPTPPVSEKNIVFNLPRQNTNKKDFCQC